MHPGGQGCGHGFGQPPSGGVDCEGPVTGIVKVIGHPEGHALVGQGLGHDIG